MAKKFDAVVIGGGVLGCFAARELRRYDMSVALLERHGDVCTEISRANTAVVYGGYDSQPDTLKTRLCVAANRDFRRLCGELDVKYNNCGALMTCFGERGEAVIRERIDRGAKNGVEGLRLIDHDELMELEPNISVKTRTALFAPMVGTVDPWGLGIAAAENAIKNGAEFFFGSEALKIAKNGDGYVIETCGGTFYAGAVVNCAGLNTDTVSELIAKPYFRIKPSRGDYIVLDTRAEGFLHHVIFHEPEERGKGATLTPTVDGNILLGPSQEDADNKHDFGTSEEGLSFVRRTCSELFPKLPLELVIRSFAALRPHPFWVDGDGVSGKKINDYIVGSPEDAPGFFNMAGIKTPGLTCSAKLGEYIAGKVSGFLGKTDKNGDFDPVRVGIPHFAELNNDARRRLYERDPRFAGLVCRCRGVTEGEIIEAIRRMPGDVTVDGVKRRTGAGMGRCQGSFCGQRVAELIAAELGIPVGEVQKDRAGSYIFEEGAK